MSSKPAVLLSWQLSDLHGWGIAGHEIFSHWALKGRYQPVMGYPISDNEVRGMDSLRKKLLLPSFHASNDLNAQIVQATQDTSKVLTINIPVVHALGNLFAYSGMKLRGSANIGRIVFEFDNLHTVAQTAKEFDAFVVASQWNFDLLRAVTDKPVFLNHEGVDTTRFQPGPKSGLLSEDDFYIFSSGKIEYRKAQDLVLAVFKKFSQGKQNVKLVTAWQSVFAKHISRGYKGILDIGVDVDDSSVANIEKWAADNGIPTEKIIDIGQVPHHTVPYVMREMDVALQLSRAEGGTNFVAMECMACGVPTLISRSTGHLDIINYPNAIPVEVTSQMLSHIEGGADWREADIDDAVEKLEILYKQKRETGTTHGKSNFPRTWTQHSQDLEHIISKYYV
jgi:glycosyltransferase involved in cell wall biosynthesis